MLKQDQGENSNVWYPHHVSDRADELMGELQPSHCRVLFTALQTHTVSAWLNWLEVTSKDVLCYDVLNKNERSRRLNSKNNVDALRYHHACIFLELWRTRVHSSHLALPPNGPPLDSASSLRQMMIGTMTAYNSMEAEDFWPFAYPEEARWPFKSE